jgi:hypothetical protein
VKLSAAIRNGIDLVPHTKGQCFRFDASGEDWAGQEAHKKPLLGADALGTALVGLAGSAAAAVERTYEGARGAPLAVLKDLYPELWKKRDQCPVCKAKRDWSPPPPQMLIGILYHLQDKHEWTREQVAEYLEGRGE